jgi:hypothetical protein
MIRFTEMLSTLVLILSIVASLVENKWLMKNYKKNQNSPEY